MLKLLTVARHNFSLVGVMHITINALNYDTNKVASIATVLRRK